MPSLKKVNFGLAAVLASSLFLIACGGSSDSASDDIANYTPETPYNGKTTAGELTPENKNEIAEAVVKTILLHSLEAAEYIDNYPGQDELETLVEDNSVSNRNLSSACDSGTAIGSGSDSENSFNLNIKYSECSYNGYSNYLINGIYTGSIIENAKLVKKGQAKGTLEYKNIIIKDVSNKTYKKIRIDGTYKSTYTFANNSDNETYIWEKLAITVDGQQITASGKVELIWDGKDEKDVKNELYSIVIDGETYQLQSTSTIYYENPNNTDKEEVKFYHPDHGQFTIEASIEDGACSNSTNLEHSNSFVLTDQKGNELEIEGSGCSTAPSVTFKPAAQ